MDQLLAGRRDPSESESDSNDYTCRADSDGIGGKEPETIDWWRENETVRGLSGIENHDREAMITARLESPITEAMHDYRGLTDPIRARGL